MNVYPPLTQENLGAPPEPSIFRRPFQVLRPARQTLPFVFASPHSGRNYPAEFLAASRLDLLTLRRSEDGFVDELFAGAPAAGAPLLHALFPRAFIDPNREPYELDPCMFADSLPSFVNTRSLRVAGGLGTVARVVTDGAEIYHQKMHFAEVQHRIDTLYMPYHQRLRRLLEETKARFGYAILFDCHSMPSTDGHQKSGDADERTDIVLGDRFGTSCAPGLTQFVEESFMTLGYSVTRNNPYAGGYTTNHYGRPMKNVHALQIEINRGLYMDEDRMVRGAHLPQIAQDMGNLIRLLSDLIGASLHLSL